MRFGIVVFPGSNCDEDAFLRGRRPSSGRSAEYFWHKDHRSEGRRRRDSARRVRARRLSADRRDGALLADHGARCRAFAERGGPVLGICNGFQILLEAGLLPGAMLRNTRPEVPLRARPRPRRADRHAVHARARPVGQVLRMPIGARRRQLLRAARRSLRAARSATGRWSSATRDARGRVDRRGESRTDRSTRSPASATSARNVVGMMPHPERACEPLLGSADGRVHLRIDRATLAGVARCSAVGLS